MSNAFSLSIHASIAGQCDARTWRSGDTAAMQLFLDGDHVVTFFAGGPLPFEKLQRIAAVINDEPAADYRQGYEAGEHDAESRARCRPGDGDMGG